MQDFSLLWGVLAPPGAPVPETEYRFAPPRRYRFDYCWPERLVAVEIDGGQWKAGGGRHNTDADRAKLNLAAAQGWRVLRFSHSMLRDMPEACIATVCEALDWTP